MARYTGPVCRLCRREGEKLFLKGERCYSSSCAFEKRPGGPGQHGKSRKGAGSDYKKQLREKQKVRTYYGLKEGTFKKVFTKAAHSDGVTGTQMLSLLETRLDNIVYRLGFAFSRAQARQMVVHGNIKVNGNKVDRPGYTLSVGDSVEVVDNQKNNPLVTSALEATSSRGIADWLELEKSSVKGTLKVIPSREQMPQTFNEQNIVELYSR